MSRENLKQYVLARQLHLLNVPIDEQQKEVNLISQMLMMNTKCNPFTLSRSELVYPSLLLERSANSEIEAVKSILLQSFLKVENAKLGISEYNRSSDVTNNRQRSSNTWPTSKAELFSIISRILRFLHLPSSYDVCKGSTSANNKQKLQEKEIESFMTNNLWEEEEEEEEEEEHQQEEQKNKQEKEEEELQEESGNFSQKKVFYIPSPYCEITQRDVTSNASTTKTLNTKSISRVESSLSHKIFIRMLHPQQLNEESLNTYFGRYGQVTVQVLSRQRLTDWASSSSENRSKVQYHSSHPIWSNIAKCVINGYASLFESVPVNELWIQDFVITLDSALNVQLALSRAYYKELLFIALHSDTTIITNNSNNSNSHCSNEVNRYFTTDLDEVLLKTLPVVKMSSYRVDERTDSVTDNGNEYSNNNQKAKKHKRKDRTNKNIRNVRRVTSKTEMNDEQTRLQYNNSEELENEYEDEYEDEEDEEKEEKDDDDDDGNDDDSSFVPDIVIDNFPYWTTEDQIKVFLQEYGTITRLHLSVDDLSGTFAGAVMVRMESLQEAILLAKGAHQRDYMNETILRAGVLTPELELQDVLTGEVLWSAHGNGKSSSNSNAILNGNLSEGKYAQEQSSLMNVNKVDINERLWV